MLNLEVKFRKRWLSPRLAAPHNVKLSWGKKLKNNCFSAFFPNPLQSSGMPYHKQSGKQIPWRCSADVWKPTCALNDCTICLFILTPETSSLSDPHPPPRPSFSPLSIQWNNALSKWTSPSPSSIPAHLWQAMTSSFRATITRRRLQNTTVKEREELKTNQTQVLPLTSLMPNRLPKPAHVKKDIMEAPIFYLLHHVVCESCTDIKKNQAQSYKLFPQKRYLLNTELGLQTSSHDHVYLTLLQTKQ